MAEEAKSGSASDKVGMALLEHADQLTDRFEATRAALSEQIEQLQELQKWTVASVQGMQQKADAAIQRLEGERQKLEAERARMQTIQGTFELNAMQAIQNAVQRQSVEIERVTVRALSGTFGQIEQAAGHVNRNVKETKWVFLIGVFALGMVVSLLLGNWWVIQNQNAISERLNRIEQNQTAQVQSAAAPPAQQGAPHLGKQR